MLDRCFAVNNGSRSEFRPTRHRITEFAADSTQRSHHGFGRREREQHDVDQRRLVQRTATTSAGSVSEGTSATPGSRSPAQATAFNRCTAFQGHAPSRLLFGVNAPDTTDNSRGWRFNVMIYKARGVVGPGRCAAGQVVRFRRSTPDRIVRSRWPALPAIISVEVNRTVAALVASQEGADRRQTDGEAAKKRLADAEARLRRFQAAIAAGVDPNALVEVINAARAEGRAAQAKLTTRPRRMTRLATCQLRFRCG